MVTKDTEFFSLSERRFGKITLVGCGERSNHKIVGHERLTFDYVFLLFQALTLSLFSTKTETQVLQLPLHSVITAPDPAASLPSTNTNYVK